MCAACCGWMCFLSQVADDSQRLAVRTAASDWLWSNRQAQVSQRPSLMGACILLVVAFSLNIIYSSFTLRVWRSRIQIHSARCGHWYVALPCAWPWKLKIYLLSHDFSLPRNNHKLDTLARPRSFVLWFKVNSVELSELLKSWRFQFDSPISSILLFPLNCHTECDRLKGLSNLRNHKDSSYIKKHMMFFLLDM